MADELAVLVLVTCLGCVVSGVMTVVSRSCTRQDRVCRCGWRVLGVGGSSSWLMVGCVDIC